MKACITKGFLIKYIKYTQKYAKFIGRFNNLTIQKEGKSYDNRRRSYGKMS